MKYTLILLILTIAVSGCYVHHDNDRCVNDNKIRHSKYYHR